MEPEVTSGMLEDFTQALSTIHNFNANEPQLVLERAEEMLEYYCEVYLRSEYTESVQQRAMEFITEAQALGYCQ